MKKIILILLIMGIVLVSGCIEYSNNDFDRNQGWGRNDTQCERMFPSFCLQKYDDITGGIKPEYNEDCCKFYNENELCQDEIKESWVANCNEQTCFEQKGIYFNEGCSAMQHFRADEITIEDIVPWGKETCESKKTTICEPINGKFRCYPEPIPYTYWLLTFTMSNHTFTCKTLIQGEEFPDLTDGATLIVERCRRFYYSYECPYNYCNPDYDNYICEIL